MKATAHVAAALAGVAMLTAHAQAAAPPSCQRVVLAGEVSAGQEWRASIGRGWVFRVLPIDSRKPGSAAYSGWDLVVDHDRAAGFPDALLVATPPYSSINQREIGTTFGLRAQDAIGWNPRSFRFLTDAAAFAESQPIFLKLIRGARDPDLSRQLLDLEQHASAGQFRILDARLSPGLADAAPFAQDWALKSARTQHELAPPAGGARAELGELRWMRFSITLWLPADWRLPAGLQAARAACSE